VSGEPRRYPPMSFAIDTQRLILRLRDAEDAAVNLALLREHEGGTSLTLKECREHLVKQRAEAEESGLGFLGVRRRAEGDRIGYCGLLVGRGSVDEPEIAYEILPEARGRGYTTEAARAVMEAAFATGRRTLWATVRGWNGSSFAVLEKLNFHRHHSVVDDRGELVYLVRYVSDPPPRGST